MDASTANVSRAGDLDLHAAVVRVWARRWWVVASVFVVTVAFGSAAFVMTPIYRATTVAVHASPDRTSMGGLTSALGQLGGLAALAGVELDPSAIQVEEALAVLRSRAFTEGFIKDRQLMPKLFPDEWDASARGWKGNEEDWPTLAQAFKRFDKRVRIVTQDKKTSLITVSIEWRDREEAAQWANELVARLNSEMRARAIAQTNASMSYLQKELAATQTIGTREAINRLMEAQINERMFANVTAEYALRIVDRALPPDRRDVIRPKKALMLALGAALGFVLGALLVLMMDSASTTQGRQRER